MAETRQGDLLITTHGIPTAFAFGRNTQVKQQPAASKQLTTARQCRTLTGPDTARTDRNEPQRGQKNATKMKAGMGMEIHGMINHSFFTELHPNDILHEEGDGREGLQRNIPQHNRHLRVNAHFPHTAHVTVSNTRTAPDRDVSTAFLHGALGGLAAYMGPSKN